MDSNLVARVNVDAYCPKIRNKRQNVHSHVGCPKPSVWEMKICSDQTSNGPCCCCRGIVTAVVLELGLSRGAIAARKLEGVMRDKEHEGLYWFGPLR